MEEDLKVVEGLCRCFRYEQSKLDELDRNDYAEFIQDDEVQAIENLVKGYRDLEKELESVKEIYYTQKEIETDYIPNERLIHYMDVALENSKQYLKKGNKIRANEEYKRYKDLKDIVDDLVYHKTLGKGNK